MPENILEKIVVTKKKEIEALPDFEFYVEETKKLPEARSFVKALEEQEGPALIAEVKKASPSRGVIRENFNPLEIANDYIKAGANCLSVLTDKEYFQGDIEYLSSISKLDLPVLRKDFIIDKRQIVEARLAGADAILLIVAILDDNKLERFHDVAHGLGMGVLLEVHNEEEMRRALKLSTKLIGINNRDLKTFETDIHVTKDLIAKFAAELDGRIIISESGIYDHAQVSELFCVGVKGFLVGESLMRQDDLNQAVKELLAR